METFSPDEPGLVPAGPRPLAAEQYPGATLVRAFLGRIGTRIFAPDGQLACFVKAKLPCRGAAETTLFADEGETQRPMTVMKARQVVGFKTANHDIFDAASGARIGSVRNRGVGVLPRRLGCPQRQRSAAGRDGGDGEWCVPPSRLPILRNGRWKIRHGGSTVVARISERWTLFSKKYDLNLSGAQGLIHPSFAMACTILCLNRESAREAR